MNHQLKWQQFKKASKTGIRERILKADQKSPSKQVSLLSGTLLSTGKR
jgi:hypothetical protein